MTKDLDNLGMQREELARSRGALSCLPAELPSQVSLYRACRGSDRGRPRSREMSGSRTRHAAKGLQSDEWKGRSAHNFFVSVNHHTHEAKAPTQTGDGTLLTWCTFPGRGCSEIYPLFCRRLLHPLCVSVRESLLWSCVCLCVRGPFPACGTARCLVV